MADEMFPTVLVRWEGNNSKRYDNTKEEILVSNIVAINKTAVIEPSLDQISVGDHIEYEFVAKKGKVQLWHGVVVSTDPDAGRRTGSVPNEPETTSNERDVAVPLPKKRVIWTLQTLLLPNSVLLPRRCLRIWVLPKASGRSVTAVRHYLVQDQSGNVVGVLFVLVFI